MIFSKGKFFLIFILILPGCGNSANNIKDNYVMQNLEELRFEAEQTKNLNEKYQKYKSLESKYKKLAEENDADAQFILGDIYARGLNGNVEEKLGFQWTKKSADNDNLDAIVATAMNYESGVGVLKNLEMAKKYYIRASNLGSSQGQYSLGMIYLNEGNIDLGLDQLELSAIQNDPYALFEVGLIYCDGDVVVKDYKKCNSYWERAAKLGHRDSAYNVGINYDTGKGEKNIEKAIEYYKLASDRNEGKASYNLGIIYENKDSNYYDLNLSKIYFRKALEQGVDQARIKLK